VGLPRGVHVKVHLLNDVGDVRSGKREVLEGAGEAPSLFSSRPINRD
jgi:hypothetical protein